MLNTFHAIPYSAFPRWVPCYSLESTLERLALIGYRYVELAGVRPQAWPDDFPIARIQAIRGMLRDLGLKVTGITPVIAPHFNPASTIAAERRDAVDYLTRCADLSAELGGDFLTCSVGYSVIPTSRQEAYSWSLEAFALLAERLQKRGLKLALEAVWKGASDLVYRSVQAVAFAESLQAQNVGFAMDTCNVALVGEDVFETIRRYGNALLNVHLEDIDPTGERVFPGEGILPLAEIVRFLKSFGYKGPICAEYLRVEDPDEYASACFTYFEALLNE